MAQTPLVGRSQHGNERRRGPIDLAETAAVIEKGMAEGIHPGAQLYVSLDGAPVAERAWGDAHPGMPMSTDTVLPWFCSGKPLVALAIGRLWEQGKVDFESPVASYVPEFASGGKEAITVRHLLTHTTGWSADPIAAIPFANWDAMLRAVCDAPHDCPHRIGVDVAYSVWTNWFLLAEVIQRVQPLGFAEFMRREVLGPPKLRDAWFSMTPDEHARCKARLGTVYEMKNGRQRPNRFLASREACTRSVPSIGARGTMRELGHLYETLLLPPRAKRRVVAPDTLSYMTARHRTGMPDTTTTEGIDSVDVDWGLGFALQSGNDSWRAFSQWSSPGTFGHWGLRSSVAFADPVHRLVVAVVTNGMPEGVVHRERQRAILDAVYTDLGLS